MENIYSANLSISVESTIAQVEALIDLAVADGVLTREELNTIRTEVLADGEVSAEECQLMSSLFARVKRGELQVDW